MKPWHHLFMEEEILLLMLLIFWQKDTIYYNNICTLMLQYLAESRWKLIYIRNVQFEGGLNSFPGPSSS